MIGQVGRMSNVSLIREEAIEVMKEHFKKEERFVNHALRVTEFAESITRGEGIEHDFFRQVITLAGIFHDVGIPVALEKHGTSAGPYQELEGEPVARNLLTRLEVRPDILERVCYIVRHHHTHAAVDGLDFQVIWEADALVNIPNWWGRRTSEHTLPEVIELNFRTATGKALITQWARESNYIS
jgi:hypothetical protein